MFRLLEHAGWMRAHDPHHWWVFDCRETSPKTCTLCLSLHTTHYRGDELDNAFPYHVHRHVNAIKANAHMPRDRHCRCMLRWAGRTELVRPNPYVRDRPPKVPEIPKTVARRPVEDRLTPDLMRMRKRIVKHARESYRRKRFHVERRI